MPCSAVARTPPCARASVASVSPQHSPRHPHTARPNAGRAAARKAPEAPSALAPSVESSAETRCVSGNAPAHVPHRRLDRLCGLVPRVGRLARSRTRSKQQRATAHIVHAHVVPRRAQRSRMEQRLHHRPLRQLSSPSHAQRGPPPLPHTSASCSPAAKTRAPSRHRPRLPPPPRQSARDRPPS